MSDDNSHADLKFLLGLFIGGIIGAVIIFFLGTKEGKKTGKMLEEKGKDLLSDLEEKVTDLEEKGEDLLSQGEEEAQKVIQQVEEKKEQVTIDATEKIDSALAHIEKMQEQGAQTTAELRKRLFKNTPKKR
jgi:gas vesicle protein